MTTERFQGVYINDNLLKLRDNGVVKVLDNDGLGNLLNVLARENMELKKENKEKMQTILKLTENIEDCTHDIKMIGEFLNE